MSILKKIKNRIFPSVQTKRVRPWFKINGDRTLRLDYELNENSVVFDLGGYEGQWTSDIFSKYVCEVFVFEPYLPYAKNIQKRFERNKKIKIFSFGLGKDDATLKLYADNDASSVFKKTGQEHRIEIKKATTFIKEINIVKIQVMKINIEGGEYDLLEELIQEGTIRIIENLQIQFHDFVKDADTKMKKIQTALAVTHELSYQYLYVWENWTLKK